MRCAAAPSRNRARSIHDELDINRRLPRRALASSLPACQPQSLGIWLTTKRLLICWPIVLLADFLYLVVFYQARLFSDALLQVFFVAFTLYGWWHWWRGIRAEGEVRVVPLSMRGWHRWLAAGAVGAVLLGWLMVRIGAALPHLDAALTSYSLVASWWGARKHIANWWLWIVVDPSTSASNLQGSARHGTALCRTCCPRRPRPARLAPRCEKSLVPSP